MANCNCSGSTYATVNRGYGCLSSVPTSSGVPYNCFLPPTNMSYYQNYPFYNGPCGSVPGSSGAGGNGGCGCKPWCNPCCCNGSNSEPEMESSGSSSSSCGCWNPCKPCNPCCGPAALVATSSGAVTPAANTAVPLVQSTSINNNITVDGNAITIKCPGVYLVTLNSNIPSAGYNGNVSLVLNGQTLSTTTQNFATSTAANNTTQAIVRVAENSTITVVPSAANAAITPTPGTNLFTVSVVRIA